MPFKLMWISEDQQISIDCGVFASRREAEADEPDALAELLDECEGDPDCIRKTRAGHFRIQEISGNPVEEADPKENYMEIGHWANGYLWIWTGGSLEVHQMKKSKGGKWKYEVHEKAWEGVNIDSIWHGRYEPGRGITTAIPPNAVYRPIPMALVDALEIKFGADTKIVEMKVVRNNPVRIRPESEYCSRELAMGIEVELEHTDSKSKASKIARQHLEETPDYYSRLDEAGLADNPPSDGSIVPGTKAILAGGAALIWEFDRHGNPSHEQMMHESGLVERQCDAFVFFVREKWFSGIRISMLHHKSKSAGMVIEAKNIIEKYASGLLQSDTVEVETSKGIIVWSGKAGDLVCNLGE
jgi:hypothetical protein